MSVNKTRIPIRSTVRSCSSLRPGPRSANGAWTLSRQEGEVRLGLSLREFSQIDKISVCDRVAGSTQSF
jgi:hypothetical protein